MGKPQTKAILKKNLLKQQRKNSSISSDCFSETSNEDDKKTANKDELEKNNQFFVNFNYDGRKQTDNK